MSTTFPKKKKLNPWLKILIVLSVLVVLLVVFRFLGIIQWYHSEGTGNEPTLKDQEQFFATNLKTPERLDLVTFKYNYNGFEEIWVKRVVAFEGDVVAFVNSTLFVNGENVDSDLDLQYRYRGEKSYGEIVARELDLVLFEDYFPTQRPEQYLDSVDIFLQPEIAQKKPLLFRRIMTGENEFITEQWNENWSEDNFGPVTVPKDCCFLVGDNRNNTLDSRYIGFIKMDDVYGVLF